MTTEAQRILITGSNGLLGQKLVELFSHLSRYSLLLTSRQERSVFDDETLTYRQLDITNKQQVRSVLDEFEPHVIINAAGMTDVDLCEKEREQAWRINAAAVENIVNSAKLVGARIIHFSTDYVFDGRNGPYDEFQRPNPLNYYGRTKLASENILRTSGVPHTIIRTMLLYGMGYGVKLNFALWLLKELSEERSVRVVDDQTGNPTLADDVAYATLKVIELNRPGLYHVAGPELMSRHAFALALARTFKFPKKLILPVRSTTLKQTASRPLKSGFITLKAETDLGVRMSAVDQGLVALKHQLDAQMKEYHRVDS